MIFFPRNISVAFVLLIADIFYPEFFNAQSFDLVLNKVNLFVGG